MFLTLDLTARQAARVLEQAIRTHAKLELEPAPALCPQLVWGSLEKRCDGLLHVPLHEGGDRAPLAAIIGAVCEARMILSGQLYLFSTVVVDVHEKARPRCILLAAPHQIRSANRRRYARHAPTQQMDVTVRIPGADAEVVGEIMNVGPNGLGCVVPGPFAEKLLVGDPVCVSFELPWLQERFAFDSILCNKNRSCDGQSCVIGVEFADTPDDSINRAQLARLRDLIQRETENLIETDGLP